MNLRRLSQRTLMSIVGFAVVLASGQTPSEAAQTKVEVFRVGEAPTDPQSPGRRDDPLANRMFAGGFQPPSGPSCQDQLNAANAMIASLQGQLNAANATIASLQTQVAVLTAQNNQLQVQLNTANSRILDLRSQVTLLTQQNADLANQLVAAQQTVVNLSAQVAQLQGQIATLTEENTQLRSSLAAANATIAGLNGQIAQLQGQVATLTADNARLTAVNHDLEAKLAVANAMIATQKATIRSLVRTVFNLPPDANVANSARDEAETLLAQATGVAGLADERIMNAERKLDKGIAALARADFKEAVNAFREAFRMAAHIVGIPGVIEAHASK